MGIKRNGERVVRCSCDVVGTSYKAQGFVALTQPSMSVRKGFKFSIIFAGQVVESEDLIWSIMGSCCNGLSHQKEEVTEVV